MGKVMCVISVDRAFWGMLFTTPNKEQKEEWRGTTIQGLRLPHVEYTVFKNTKNTQTEKLKQKGKIKLFSKWENKETVEDSTMREGLM